MEKIQKFKIFFLRIFFCLSFRIHSNDKANTCRHAVSSFMEDFTLNFSYVSFRKFEETINTQTDFKAIFCLPINFSQVHPDIASIHLTAQYGNFYIVYSFTTSGSFSPEKLQYDSQVPSKDKPEKKISFRMCANYQLNPSSHDLEYRSQSS